MAIIARAVASSVLAALLCSAWVPTPAAQQTGTTAAVAADSPRVVIPRLVAYARDYLGRSAALVMEEDYLQRVPERRRRLRSDLLLVRPEQGNEWVSFRDVFEVDGKPVRDREDRLQQLFLNQDTKSKHQLDAIKAESARFNIGSIERNINVPLYPLKFLQPAASQRFAFDVTRQERRDGRDCVHVRFVESQRPTIIRDTSGRSIPTSGTFVIEGATGAIVETRLRIDDPDYSVLIIVTYAYDPALRLWIPAVMREAYARPGVDDPFEAALGSRRGAQMDGTATYSRVRRFSVSTEESVKIEKH